MIKKIKSINSVRINRHNISLKSLGNILRINTYKDELIKKYKLKKKK